MKNDFDEEKLTAFALGELSVEEERKVAEEIAASPSARAVVEETESRSRLKLLSCYQCNMVTNGY